MVTQSHSFSPGPFAPSNSFHSSPYLDTDPYLFPSNTSQLVPAELMQELGSININGTQILLTTNKNFKPAVYCDGEIITDIKSLIQTIKPLINPSNITPELIKSIAQVVHHIVGTNAGQKFIEDIKGFKEKWIAKHIGAFKEGHHCKFYCPSERHITELHPPALLNKKLIFFTRHNNTIYKCALKLGGARPDRIISHKPLHTK